MPLNKSAVIRYQIIDQVLGKGGYHSKNELLSHIEGAVGQSVSGRTLENDIRAMREDEQLGYLAPIKYSKSNNGYYYDSSGYRPPGSLIHGEEIELLELTLSVLKGYQKLPMYQKAEAVMQRVEHSSRSKRGFGKRLDDFVFSESTVEVQGLEWFQKLIDHIQFEHVISISYQSFYSEKALSYKIHPYGLKEFDRRWYLIALKDATDELRAFGLDRIKNIDPNFSRTGFKPSNRSLQEVFKHIYGISGFNNDPEVFRVKIPYPQANYEKSRPIHPSFEVIKDVPNEFVEIQLNVVNNWEIQRWVRMIDGEFL